MSDYQGIIIDKSLRDTETISRLSIVRKRQIGSWGFFLVSVSEDEVQRTIEWLQNHMIDIRTDCWYAHFFSGDSLVIVYQDKVFRCTIDRTTWKDAIAHGLANGVPPEQLDFVPNTFDAAECFFSQR